MLEIINIEAQSIAADLGIESGAEIISINGHEINDRLDYRFYVSEEYVELRVRQDGAEIFFEIEKEADDQLGIIPQEMQLKSCGNNCIFCFVPQNPQGMRKALYFKDEDYRYSFMYGHYVTLTTLKQKELDRIVEQKLSPLYISVHSTEEKTRKYLLGIKRDDHLLEKIEYLTSNGIELHAQIVLCPEINDGAVFDQTVEDLSKYYPQLRSVAVVPLGLTQHRGNLPKLRLHRADELKKTILHVNQLRAVFYEKLGKAFVYLADEFFIKALEELPAAEYYDDFYQIENGVGEFREMIDRFNDEWPQMPKGIEKPVKITWVTGVLAAGSLEKYILSKLRAIENLEIDLAPVMNEFYGTAIQVSGLLVGQDIYNQLKEKELGDLVFLPPRVLNEDGLFLDDWTVERLEESLGLPCHVYTEALAEFVGVLDKLLLESNEKKEYLYR